MNIKYLTVIYIFCLLTLIAVVDLGNYKSFFHLVYAIPYGDKVGHFILIGLLAFAVNLSFGGRKVKLFKHFEVHGLIIVLAIVTFEEFTQLLVETRTFDLGDLGCDYAGIFVFGQLARYFL
jgi:hypothetical protein